MRNPLELDISTGLNDQSISDQTLLKTSCPAYAWDGCPDVTVEDRLLATPRTNYVTNVNMFNVTIQYVKSKGQFIFKYHYN